jgi:hypothetical protein
MELAKDPLAAARGIANGLCISLFIWAVGLFLAGPMSLHAF